MRRPSDPVPNILDDPMHAILASRRRRVSDPGRREASPMTPGTPASNGDTGSTNAGVHLPREESCERSLRADEVEDTVRRVLKEALADSSMKLMMQTVLNTYDDFSRDLAAHERRIMNTVRTAIKNSRSRKGTSTAGYGSSRASDSDTSSDESGGSSPSSPSAPQWSGHSKNAGNATSARYQVSEKKGERHAPGFVERRVLSLPANFTATLTGIREKDRQRQKKLNQILALRVDTKQSLQSSLSPMSTRNSDSHGATDDSPGLQSKDSEAKEHDASQAASCKDLEKIATCPLPGNFASETSTRANRWDRWLERKVASNSSPKKCKRKSKNRIIPGLSILEDQVQCELLSRERMETFQVERSRPSSGTVSEAQSLPSIWQQRIPQTPIVPQMSHVSMANRLNALKASASVARHQPSNITGTLGSLHDLADDLDHILPVPGRAATMDKLKTQDRRLGAEEQVLGKVDNDVDQEQPEEGTNSESASDWGNSALVKDADITRSKVRSETTLSGVVRKSLASIRHYLMTHEQEVESLRQRRVAELTEMFSGSDSLGEFSSGDEIGSGESSCELIRDVPGLRFLRACSILPWIQEYDHAARQQRATRFAWFNRFVAFLTVAGVGVCIAALISTRTAESRNPNCHGHSCSVSGRLADCALAVGSLLSFISFGIIRQSHVLGAGNSLLTLCARRQGFLERWLALSQWDLAATCLLWMVVVAERVRSTIAWCQVVQEEVNALTVVFFMSFGLATGILMASAYLILLIARAMAMMIDTFSFHFIQRPDFSEAVRDWNILQAVLRKACGSVERCFLILLTSAAAAVLLGFVEFMLSISDGAQTLISLSPLLPGTLVAIIVVRIVFRAAFVSEKCARVPALINSLSFGSEIDQDRRYVVDYINNSAAGFYVYEVRLTSAMAFKFAYMSGLVMFGVATKIASDRF